MTPDRRGRDLVSLDDLPLETVLGLLDLAARLEREPEPTLLEGQLLASLFFEPSTRTRLSFEAAALRLGGRVISVADAGSSSAAKGEALADTVRMVDSYADLIVLRHAQTGAARLAANLTQHPLLNAGDGAGEHPSQTLCDLFVLRGRCSGLSDLTVLLYGDLLHGRTVHSLSRALVRLGARLICVAEDGLGLSKAFEGSLLTDPGWVARTITLTGLGPCFPRGQVVARVIAREGGHLPPGAEWELPAGSVDALYVTRLQTERQRSEPAQRDRLPQVDLDFLSAPAFGTALVMHPLPRVSELAFEVDQDARAAYFQQVAAGVPVRMALLGWCSGRLELRP